jgi:tRNA (guanine-N7-)-methyltransferase
MRKRANLDARMERCAALLIEEPEKLRGRWLETFPGHERLHVELGCGKGRFTADTAETMPETLYIAVEKVPDAMILAMEKIDRRGLENVRFIDADAKLLNTMFAEGEAERIYINFCDPWPKSRDAKLRLTSPFFLRVYADVLKEGGQIHFKTDNTPLFDWSIGQFEAEGWQLSEITHDLHANGPVGVMTDYEAKFYEQGMRINRLVATRTADSRSLSRDGAVPRLRNASLTDARGYEESLEANRRNNA